MFIYNVTIKVDWSIHDQWLSWMLETELPRMTNQQYFNSHQLVRLLETDDTDGPTYAAQYSTKLLDNYYRYMNEQSPIDGARSYALWGQNCVFFTTLLEVVD